MYIAALLGGGHVVSYTCFRQLTSLQWTPEECRTGNLAWGLASQTIVLALKQGLRMLAVSPVDWTSVCSQKTYAYGH